MKTMLLLPINSTAFAQFVPGGPGGPDNFGQRQENL